MGSPADVAGEIEKAIGKAAQPPSSAQLLEIGHEAINIMVLRTKAGLDADLNPFVAYAPEYARERQAAGLTTRPDLARTGEMLGAMVPVSEPDAVTIRFLSAADERKAQFHNEGTNANNRSSFVSSHSRGVFVDKATGRRVSRREAALDSRRKNKRVTQRTESVSAHQRQGGVPRREFFDVRAPSEIAVIEESIDAAIQGNVEKLR